MYNDLWTRFSTLATFQWKGDIGIFEGIKLFGMIFVVCLMRFTNSFVDIFILFEKQSDEFSSELFKKFLLHVQL